MLFEFDNALVRDPAPTVVKGLTSQPGPPPEFAAVAREHALYVQALTECGLSVERLPPLEDFPDSIFVEDPALVFGDAAILLRPGAPSRLGEGAHLESALLRRFEQVLQMQHGFADGGDMLLTPQGMFIGLSRRTDHAGAAELGGLLQQLGISSRIVATPADTLHLKSDCSLIDDDHIVCTAGLGASGLFEGYRKLIVPDNEKQAANVLRLNDILLVGDRFPRTIDLLAGHGYKVRPIPTTNTGKLDAGLSCMSLRWKARRPN
jgi:dimethylargininase